MHKIVIVEDELIAAEYLKRLLETNGFLVLAVINSGASAIREVPPLAPDLVLMDIMLKDNISGSEVALQLKHKTPDTAIVFLTAYAENEMLEYAMDSNTYGYMMKPYEEQRIIASLKIILSRIEKDKVKDTSKDSHLVHVTDTLIFDMQKKRLFNGDAEVTLGTKPLTILHTLCKQPNITVSSEQLCMDVWGEAKETSMLRTQISRLKKSLDNAVIENVKGLGYKIVCKPIS